MYLDPPLMQSHYYGKNVLNKIIRLAMFELVTILSATLMISVFQIFHNAGPFWLHERF